VVVERLSGHPLVAALDLMARGDSGVFGGACCNGIEQGLNRLSTSFAAMTPGVSVDTARQALSSSFDLALEVCTNSDGRDRVRRVAELATGHEGATQLSEIYSFVAERTAAGGSVEGTFVATGTEPRLVEELRARGIAVDGSLFHRSGAS
jgi:pilus assembly protein CpaF